MKILAMGLAALLTSNALQAQTARKPAVPAGMQDPQAMMKAMEDAQSAAKQPGDEKLTCSQLEEKVLAASQDPAFQAHVQAMGSSSQAQMDASQVSKTDRAARTAATAAAATLPGASMGQLLASKAEHQTSIAQGRARQQSMMLQAQEAMRSMPMLMRAQRLLELGVAKRCEWAVGATEDSGATAPAAKR
jgi:hypothetical protein